MSRNFRTAPRRRRANRELQKLIRVTPEERAAFDELIAKADVIHVAGQRTFLLIEARPELLDALAAYGSLNDDRECCVDGEPDPHDDALSLVPTISQDEVFESPSMQRLRLGSR